MMVNSKVNPDVPKKIAEYINTVDGKFHAILFQ
jgi:hypothetical protein